MSNYDASCTALFIPVLLLNVIYWSSIIQQSRDKERERELHKKRVNQALEEWLKKRKKHGVYK